MITKVYLAGGYRSNWQDQVKELEGLIFYDPKEKERPAGAPSVPMSLEEYGTWDLHHIKQSDIVFVNMERTNPSGIGLSVEAGYARGLGKTVILVLEPNHETQQDRYLQFLRKAADITFNNLEDAIEYLNSFARI
jgi:nucleoside 2-deoxyribosyltransferase